MNLKDQKRLKALFDEGYEIRISDQVAGDYIVSGFYAEPDDDGFCVNSQEYPIIPLGCVLDDCVRVFREVKNWQEIATGYGYRAHQYLGGTASF